MNKVDGLRAYNGVAAPVRTDRVKPVPRCLPSSSLSARLIHLGLAAALLAAPGCAGNSNLPTAPHVAAKEKMLSPAVTSPLVASS